MHDYIYKYIIMHNVDGYGVLCGHINNKIKKKKKSVKLHRVIKVKSWAYERGKENYDALNKSVFMVQIDTP